MACRVGITTDLDRRKEEWQAEHPNLSDWQILAACKNKTDAQKLETQYAQSYGCNAAPGDDGDENTVWYVYKFNY